MNCKKQKYAFTGPFADINFGDYAMLINNIYDLNIDNCTIFSYDTTFSENIKKDYLSEVNMEIIEVELMDSEIGKNNVIPLELLNLVKNTDVLYNAIEKIDVLIVNGGGYFNGLWSMPHRLHKLVKIIIPILIANQLNKKIIFTGNGYGPFGDDEEFFSSIFNVLKNVTYGTRDQLYSASWLNGIGVSTDKIKFIPDDLLIVNNKLLNMENNFELKSNRYIVVETYLPVEYLKDNIKDIKSFSTNIKSKYNLDIVFLPLNVEHGGMDQALYLKKEIENFEIVNISEKGYLPIQDAENIIKNAEMVISSRYHALVLALYNKTPVISVLKDVMGNKKYYYNKNFGVIKQVFKDIPLQEDFYLSTDYLLALDFIDNNFEKIRDYQKERYNNKHIENIKELKNTRNEFLTNI